MTNENEIDSPTALRAVGSRDRYRATAAGADALWILGDRMDDMSRLVLEAISTANERMIALAATIERRPGVKKVHHELDLRASSAPDQITLSIYVDAELAHGPGIVCDLDGWWLPEWGIAASIRFVWGEDAEDVRRFPERLSKDAAGFIVNLSAVVDELVAEADRLDVASFLSRWPGG